MINSSIPFIFAIALGLFKLIVGIVMYFFPPKEINNLYGYRTKKSMKSMQSWKLGNRYVASLFILFAIVFTVVNIALISILNSNITFPSMFGIIGLIDFLTYFLAIALTEIKLSKQYHEK